MSASNSNPSGDESTDQKSARTKKSDGPPFLTILAGFLVCFFIIWIVGSIIAWLISLIANLPPKN